MELIFKVQISIIESGQISEAIRICKKVAQEVRKRRGNTSAAHIYNKFAWLGCLSNKTDDKYRDDIVNIASQAVDLDQILV